MDGEGSVVHVVQIVRSEKAGEPPIVIVKWQDGTKAMGRLADLAANCVAELQAKGQA
jgi:hypothetical protein